MCSRINIIIDVINTRNKCHAAGLVFGTIKTIGSWNEEHSASQNCAMLSGKPWILVFEWMSSDTQNPPCIVSENITPLTASALPESSRPPCLPHHKKDSATVSWEIKGSNWSPNSPLSQFHQTRQWKFKWWRCHLATHRTQRCLTVLPIILWHHSYTPPNVISKFLDR